MQYCDYTRDLAHVLDEILFVRGQALSVFDFFEKYKTVISSAHSHEMRAAKKTCVWFAEDLADLYTNLVKDLSEAQKKHALRKIKKQ